MSERLPAAQAARRRVPVRFRILGVLLAMSFVNFVLRNNLSVALPSIREEFHYSSTQLGWILSSFTIAYALFQIPGGIFGQRVGARVALTAIAVCWGVLTFLTGLAPALMAASATGAMLGLMKQSDDFSHGLNERVAVDAYFDELDYWHTLLTEVGRNVKR